MADRKYYCLCDLGCKFETMTKEQILAAIEQAINEGKITNIDTGFVTKLKELNKGGYVTVWHGTTAEYNALTEKDENCIYIKTDDTRLEDIEKAIANLIEEASETISTVNTELARLDKDKAPTGYGLGTAAVGAIGSANDKKENGVFSNAGRLSDVPFKKSFFIPIYGAFAGDGHKSYQKNIDPANGVIANRSFNNNIWGEWEYENPPMEIATDGNNPIYKTTRRFCGKPVYTTMLSVKWQKNGWKDTHIPETASVIDFCGYIDECITIPHFYTENEGISVNFISAEYGGNTLEMIGGDFYNGTDAFIQVWFIDN